MSLTNKITYNTNVFTSGGGRTTLSEADFEIARTRHGVIDMGNYAIARIDGGMVTQLPIWQQKRGINKALINSLATKARDRLRAKLDARRTANADVLPMD